MVIGGRKPGGYTQPHKGAKVKETEGSSNLPGFLAMVPEREREEREETQWWRQDNTITRATVRPTKKNTKMLKVLN